MFDSISKSFVLLMTVIIVAPVSGQQVHSYKTEPRTIYEKKPVKVSKWVDETVMEKQTVTSYKKVWQTETRTRYKTEYKPIRKTAEREERTVVRKPIVETRYRKKETRQTTYENITEMRDEQYTVRKPVFETQMREETVTVRKPITEQLIEVNRTTSFKPVWQNTTRFVPQDNVSLELGAVPDPNQRPRIRRLDSGYYTDPATGGTVYRRRGLHWVQPSTVVPVASVVPALVPQEISELSYVPETTETRKPVEVTRFVEQTETRRVPVEIQRTIERVETRKVPVTVRIPKTTIVVEDVPYTETTYVEEVIVKKVPYTETTYEKVETSEPYTVEVPRWIPETKEVEVPRVVQRRVEYEVMQDVPRTMLFRIPLDICGNEVGPATPVESEIISGPSPSSGFSSSSGTTTSRRVPETETYKSVLLTESDSGGNTEGYPGNLKLEPKTLQETSAKKPAVNVPDSAAGGSKTELGRIPGSSSEKAEPGPEKEAGNIDPAKKPEGETSDSGNEHASDRPPVPRESGDAEIDDSESDDAETGDARSGV